MNQTIDEAFDAFETAVYNYANAVEDSNENRRHVIKRARANGEESTDTRNQNRVTPDGKTVVIDGRVWNRLSLATELANVCNEALAAKHEPTRLRVVAADGIL